MLINISRFNLVQTRTQQLVEHFWRETFDAINSDILKITGQLTRPWRGSIKHGSNTTI